MDELLKIEALLRAADLAMMNVSVHDEESEKWLGDAQSLVLIALEYIETRLK